MQISNWIIIGAAEVFTLLILICIFLILHASKLKNLITGLQQKVQDLLIDLQQTKRAYAEMQDILEDDNNYVEILDEQIENTREYHLTLEPSQDISLDLDSGASIPRQIASLRHAFLISEKEATLAGENKQPNWLVMQSKLATIMAFFKGGSNSSTQVQTFEEDGDALEDLQQALSDKQKEIIQLEGTLAQAQMDASAIHQNFSQIEVTPESQETYNQLLERYQDSINLLGGDVELATLTNKVSHPNNVTHANNQTRPNNEELDQLRNLTADQHSMINQLQQRLRNAQTSDEKTLLLNDLSEQLDRQKRFLKESEMCIEQMDNELLEANNTIGDLQKKIARIEKSSGSGRQNEMTDEIKHLKNAMTRLEQENEQLLMQLGMGD